MEYRIAHDVWLKQQVDRCRGVLLQNMDHTRSYTIDELLALCSRLGLVYTREEYAEIGQALVIEKFLVVG